MAKVKNISGDVRVVPELGGRLVLEGELVEIPDDRADGYVCQVDVWEPADAAAKKAAKKLAEQLAGDDAKDGE